MTCWLHVCSLGVDFEELHSSCLVPSVVSKTFSNVKYRANYSLQLFFYSYISKFLRNQMKRMLIKTFAARRNPSETMNFKYLIKQTLKRLRIWNIWYFFHDMLVLNFSNYFGLRIQKLAVTISWFQKRSVFFEHCRDYAHRYFGNCNLEIKKGWKKGSLLCSFNRHCKTGACKIACKRR